MGIQLEWESLRLFHKNILPFPALRYLISLLHKLMAKVIEPFGIVVVYLQKRDFEKNGFNDFRHFRTRNLTQTPKRLNVLYVVVAHYVLKLLAHLKQVGALSHTNRAAPWSNCKWKTILCTKDCQCQKTRSILHGIQTSAWLRSERNRISCPLC